VYATDDKRVRVRKARVELREEDEPEIILAEGERRDDIVENVDVRSKRFAKQGVFSQTKVFRSI
jgi:hypothetical protein